MPQRFANIIYSCLVTLTLIVVSLSAPTVTAAESLQIFATVAADSDDFQLALTGPIQPGPYGAGSILTYTITYGSLLAHSTDVIVIQASWEALDPANNHEIDLLEYVADSATKGLGGAAPVIDANNQTITWQISPMPPGTNRIVSWQLKLKSTLANYPSSFSINATLIGPGLEKRAEPLRYIYAAAAPISSPTPKPTPQPTKSNTITPTLSPIPSTNPTVTAPSIVKEILETLRPIITSIVDLGQAVADGEGALAAAPIPILLVLIPAIAQIVLLIGQVPWWQIIPILIALFWSRPKKPWGVVYDAASKQPIDPAIITLINSNGEKRTTLSDFYGRYQFLAEPGTYKITAKKIHYKFPSEMLNGQQEDGAFSNLYFGGKFTLNQDDAIMYNIPLDPTMPDWNQMQKLHLERSQRWHHLSEWLFRVGLIWSIIMFSLSTSLLNGIVLTMYGSLITLRLMQRLRSPWGVVYNQQGEPLAEAAISISDVNNPLVKRPPVITNRSGRYAFLVEKGTYQLNVSIRSNGTYTSPFPGPIIEIHKRQGHIAIDLTVSDTK